MYFISVYAQVLLICARGAQPKIVYSRPPRNDTEMTVHAAASDGDETTVGNTTTAALATLASTGHRYADSSKSMSSRNNHYYGVQYYAPPVVHDTTVADAFGRQLQQMQQQQHHNQHHNQRHPLQPPTVPAAAYHQRDGDRGPWEQTAAVVHADGGPILMNPLQLQPVYDDRQSTARYAPPPPPKPHRAPQTVARLVKYAEPAAAAVAFQLPYLAAEADDRTLLDNLPALQFALQHATGKTPQPQPPPLVSTSGHQQYAALQQLPNHHHHHLRHHPVKQTQPAVHQVYPQPAPYPQLHRNHQRLLQLHPGHVQHRYAPYGAAQPATRFTQVPFLYNLPAPPTAHRHLLAPAEYDLVSRFNRLIKQREQDDRRLAQKSIRRRRPEDSGGVSSDVSVDSNDNNEDGEEEETATRPAVKPKKSKKKKKKKRPKASTTPAPPAPVEEEIDEEESDGRLSSSRRHKPSPQQDDERADDEQANSEEQESQNVHTSEQMPEGTIVHETEDELQHTLDEPSQLSEQFGGDLTFEDGGGERVEFQLHGIGGPESYKFGFDTGKGSNRQFRYEERDNGGNVHGHYGYLDNDGKMQVYNYSSHPELGYRAQKAETLEYHSAHTN
ncbi:RNA-binding protein 33-like [Aphis craccivora]|uniref:RNA-binding protein 33-like n=1 Tax=Aphis craccivora TaxID=307492 RepID=A0A6G0YJY0_APHCR|nr:RNA-binding protein 33-like [Aphis craccivora]